MTDRALTTELMTQRENISRLREGWLRLSDDASWPNIFTTYDWVRIWNEQLGQEAPNGRRALHLIVLREGDAVCGISPLVLSRSTASGLGLRRLHFASSNHEWDYNDLIVGEDWQAQTRAVIQRLANDPGGWDVLDLEHLRDVDGSIDMLQKALAEAGLHHEVYLEPERCPYMSLDRPWDDIIAQHSHATRRIHRRFAKAAMDGYHVQIIPGAQIDACLLDQLVAVEAAKHDEANPAAPFFACHRTVFQQIFTSELRASIFCALLKRQDEVLGWNLFFRCGRKLWGYLTAYDPRIAAMSPGTVMMGHIIDFGFQSGCDEFDFLNGEESYKLRWATGFHQTYRVVAWNPRLLSRGRALLYRRARVLPFLKTWRDAVAHPPPNSAIE